VLVARVLAAARREEPKHLNLRKPACTALSEGRSSISPSAVPRCVPRPCRGGHLPLIQGGLPSPWSRPHPVAAHRTSGCHVYKGTYDTDARTTDAPTRRGAREANLDADTALPAGEAGRSLLAGRTFVTRCTSFAVGPDVSGCPGRPLPAFDTLGSDVTCAVSRQPVPQPAATLACSRHPSADSRAEH
jgi:hypothetical protein